MYKGDVEFYTIDKEIFDKINNLIKDKQEYFKEHKIDIERELAYCSIFSHVLMMPSTKCMKCLGGDSRCPDCNHLISVDFSIIIAKLFCVFQEFEVVSKHSKQIIHLHDFFYDITEERKEQIAMYNDHNMNIQNWVLVIAEEYGEMIKEFNDNNPLDMYNEAIQFCALLIKYMELNSGIVAKE